MRPEWTLASAYPPGLEVVGFRISQFQGDSGDHPRWNVPVSGTSASSFSRLQSCARVACAWRRAQRARLSIARLRRSAVFDCSSERSGRAVVGGLLGPFGGGVVAAMLPELSNSFEVSQGIAATSLTMYLLPFAIVMRVHAPLPVRRGAGIPAPGRTAGTENSRCCRLVAAKRPRRTVRMTAFFQYTPGFARVVHPVLPESFTLRRRTASIGSPNGDHLCGRLFPVDRPGRGQRP
jgi:hypothetical protein